MEEQRPVVGWEGLYSVSEHGQVRGVRRERATGHPLLPSLHEFGYELVTLCRDGERVSRTVHSLVAEAFLGPCPEGQEVRHKDGVPWHNWPGNLVYGTRTENNNDRRGQRLDDDGDEICGEGHKFTPENTIWEDGGRHRKCRTCKNARARARYRKRVTGGADAAAGQGVRHDVFSD